MLHIDHNYGVLLWDLKSIRCSGCGLSQDFSVGEVNQAERTIVVTYGLRLSLVLVLFGTFVSKVQMRREPFSLAK